MVVTVLKRRDSDSLSWSVVICKGQPKRETQTETKALATAVAVISGREGERERLRPTGVSVDGSETVPEARSDRQRPDQVDMHMRKT
jgi:hypothetical protein